RPGYEPEAIALYDRLTAAGFSVAAIEPPGTGSRVLEDGPDDLVERARAALDALGVADAVALGYAHGAPAAPELAAIAARIRGAGGRGSPLVPPRSSVQKQITAALAVGALIALASPVAASAQVKNNSVSGKKVKNSSLTGADIKSSSLTGSDIKNGSLTQSDV